MTSDSFDTAPTNAEGDEIDPDARRELAWANVIPTFAAIAFVLISFVLRACEGR